MTPAQETTPLLPSDKATHARLKRTAPSDSSSTNTSSMLPTTNPNQPSSPSKSPRRHRVHTAAHSARIQTHRFLTSKIGHYAVLLLVTLDVACIFADFLISLYRCDRFCDRGGEGEEAWETAQEVLGDVSVAFSCLFLVELLASVWGSGLREFLSSKFHIFDAFVILASFILDVCLHGVLEEVGSVLIVLRLWRVIKIIEELSAEAQENMDKMEERVGELRRENEGLRRRLGVSDGGRGEGEGYGVPGHGGFR